jgi:UrcA family protein
MTTSSTALLFAVGMLSLAGTPVRAERQMTVTARSPHVERVAYTPANLASDQGVRDLQRRVRFAADRVCAPDAQTFLQTYNQLHCYNSAVRDAFLQIDDAIALYRGGRQIALNNVTVRAR